MRQEMHSPVSDAWGGGPKPAEVQARLGQGWFPKTCSVAHFCAFPKRNSGRSPRNFILWINNRKSFAEIRGGTSVPSFPAFILDSACSLSVPSGSSRASSRPVPTYLTDISINAEFISGPAITQRENVSKQFRCRPRGGRPHHLVHRTLTRV